MDEFWIEALLKKNENDRKIIKVIKTQISDGVPKGVNYASVIKRAKIDVVLGSGMRSTKSVIIKQQHTGKKAEAMKDFDVFKTESFVYRDIFSKMEQLIDEFNDPKEKLWCYMYGFKPYSTIVFEDLVTLGYQIMDRTKGLGIQEGKFVLKAIGRFHGLSKILMERGILSENDLPPFYFLNDSRVLINMFKGSMKQLSIAMATKWPKKWKCVAERVAKQEDLIVERMRGLLIFEKNNDSTFKVLNHGDCWTCNMMFKHDEDTGTPISLRFVDFQTSHISSYMWDVMYFTNTTVRPEIRRQHLHDLYRSYLNSLTSTLTFYGYDKPIPTFEEMLKEAERLEYFTLPCLGMCFPAMTSAGDEESFDLEKALDEESNGEIINSEVLFSEHFINGCGEDFERLLNNGII